MVFTLNEIRGMFLVELKFCNSNLKNVKYLKKEKERVKIITRIYVTSLCLADIDFCHSSPCQNSGTCDSLSDDYSCYCLAGFTGKSCEGLSRFSFLNFNGVVDTPVRYYNG